VHSGPWFYKIFMAVIDAAGLLYEKPPYFSDGRRWRLAKSILRGNVSIEFPIGRVTVGRV
jgi:hypothetical protein